MHLLLLLSITVIANPLSLGSPLALVTEETTSSTTAQEGAARTVEIVGTDDMKYSVTTIEAKPGEQLRIQLTSKGTMPKIAMAHNVVVLKLDADPAKFVNAGIQARETDYIAPEVKDQVIAATDMAGNGETVEVTFTVPETPGEYTYVCTFPGHFAAGMKGTLIVK